MKVAQCFETRSGKSELVPRINKIAVPDYRTH
jgi:hypothetical protein